MNQTPGSIGAYVTPQARLGRPVRPKTKGKKALRMESRDRRLTLLIALAFFGLVVARLGDVVPAAAAFRPVLLLLAASAAYYMSAHKRLRLEDALKDRILFGTITYFTWIVFIIPFSIWRGQAFKVVNILPIAIFIVLTIATVRPQKDQLDKFLKGMVALATLSALVSMRIGVSAVGRLSTGGMLDSNDLASLLAAMLPFALGIAMSMEKTKVLPRLLAWGATAAMAFILLQTGSRGGLFALIAGLGILALHWNTKRLVIFTLVASVLAPVIWTQLPVELQDRFKSITSLDADYNLTEDYGRMATWKRGIGYTFSNPVFGVGYGNFATAEGFRLRDLGQFGASPYYSAHNAYIQAFAELGLIGGGILLFLLWEGARRGRRLFRLGRPEYLASLVAFCTGAIFLSHAYSYTLFAILGMITLGSRVLDPDGLTPAKKRRRGPRRPAVRPGPSPAGVPVQRPGP